MTTYTHFPYQKDLPRHYLKATSMDKNVSGEWLSYQEAVRRWTRRDIEISVVGICTTEQEL
jgi:hypothetical protein